MDKGNGVKIVEFTHPQGGKPRHNTVKQDRSWKRTDKPSKARETKEVNYEERNKLELRRSAKCSEVTIGMSLRTEHKMKLITRVVSHKIRFIYITSFKIYI